MSQTLVEVVRGAISSRSICRRKSQRDWVKSVDTKWNHYLLTKLYKLVIVPIPLLRETKNLLALTSNFLTILKPFLILNREVSGCNHSFVGTST